MANVQTDGFLLQRNVFDNDQYLFAQQNQAAAFLGLNILDAAVLSPSAPPFMVSGNVLAAMGSGIFEPEVDNEIKEHVVQEGDTIDALAKKFEISTQTILLANNLSSSSTLTPGKKLIILPVSGMMHVVGPGDTLSEIALIYKVKMADIAEFNNLEDESKILAGDLMIIPGATKPANYGKYVRIPLSNSYFICPIGSPCTITQGLHFYNAVDFSNGRCGDPVFAAAGGAVQRTGYTTNGGNYVRILHPNGVVTYYGHLSKIRAYAGQKVYQGQIIGYVGYTGHTIPAGPAGCHVHFDVRFSVNPFGVYKVGASLGK